MYRILVVLKFLPFSSAWWAAPWPHGSYLSHSESSVWSCSWASVFKQRQEVPVAEQWSSHLTAGVLSFSAADNAPYMCWQPGDWTGKKTQFGGRQRHPPNSWYLSFSKLDQEEVWDCSVLKAKWGAENKQKEDGETILRCSLEDWGWQKPGDHRNGCFFTPVIGAMLCSPTCCVHSDRCSDNPRVKTELVEASPCSCMSGLMGLVDEIRIKFNITKQIKLLVAERKGSAPGWASTSIHLMNAEPMRS